MTLTKYYKYSLNIYYRPVFQALKFNSEQMARKKTNSRPYEGFHYSGFSGSELTSLLNQARKKITMNVKNEIPTDHSK